MSIEIKQEAWDEAIAMLADYDLVITEEELKAVVLEDPDMVKEFVDQSFTDTYPRELLIDMIDGHREETTNEVKEPLPADVRVWECQNCGEYVEWSYDDLAERGIPICNDCDIEMEQV